MRDHLQRQMVKLAKQRPELRGTLVAMIKRASAAETEELQEAFRKVTTDLKALVARDFDLGRAEAGDRWFNIKSRNIDSFQLRFEPLERSEGRYYVSETISLNDTDLDKALTRVRGRLPSSWDFNSLKDFLQDYVRTLEKDLDKARSIADDSRARYANFQAYLNRVTNRLDKIWDGARIYNSHHSRDLTEHPVKINIPLERSMLTDKVALKAFAADVRKTLIRLLPELNRGEHQLALVPRKPFDLHHGGLDASLTVTREDGQTLY